MESSPARPAEILLRPKTPGVDKPVLKEKFVAVIQSIFNGEDPSNGRGDAFWDEVFLLKVNIQIIARCMTLTSERQLMERSQHIAMLLQQCGRCVENGGSVRSYNALVVASVLLRHMFRKKMSNFAYDVVAACGGFEAGDQWWRYMTQQVTMVMMEETKQDDDTLNVVDNNNNKAGEGTTTTTTTTTTMTTRKRIVEETQWAIQWVVVVATGADNLSSNSLVEYLYREDLFDALLHRVARCTRHTPATVFNAMQAALLVLNYQKYESSRNALLGRVASLTDPIALSALARALHDNLLLSLQSMEARKVGENSSTASSSSSSSSSSWIPFWGSSSSSPAAPLTPEVTRARVGMGLLGLYELSYLNRDFFVRTLLESRGVAYGGRDQKALHGTCAPGPDVLRVHLELSSALFTQPMDERGCLHAKMAMLCMVGWLEDPHALELLHNPKYGWGSSPPRLWRKTSNSAVSFPGGERASDVAPICYVLDALMEFCKNNVHVALQPRLHTACVQLIHRVLCYQKHHHLVLKHFRWEHLWRHCFRLLAFVSRDEWMRRPDVIELLENVLIVLNLFITYGDTFLPSGSDYDLLYYELIRESKTLTHLHQQVHKHAPDTLCSVHMENLTAIIQHFSQKIDQWCKQTDAQMQPEDVLTVIKRNYGSLKLTLLDNLDVYIPFSENPHHVSFFRQYVRVLVEDIKYTFSF